MSASKTNIATDRHPTLLTEACHSIWPQGLGEMVSPDWLTRLLRLDAAAPVASSDALRTAVRDMLRHGGYKPTGRGKPASEYLLRTAQERGLASINCAVDVCNVVSLHSGFPISVIDDVLAAPPLTIRTAIPGSEYVFNPAGQTIDVGGLVCLHDAEGPCANAVKDAQRTKTSGATMQTMSIIWGVRGFEEELTATARWYRELVERAGGIVSPIATTPVQE